TARLLLREAKLPTFVGGNFALSVGRPSIAGILHGPGLSLCREIGFSGQRRGFVNRQYTPVHASSIQDANRRLKVYFVAEGYESKTTRFACDAVIDNLGRFD